MIGGSQKNADNNVPQPTWQYWNRYEVMGEKGSRYVYAPELWREEGRWKKNESRTYPPLIRGGLFFKFARLADYGDLDPAVRPEDLDTDNNAQVAYDWADQWGVLGLTMGETAEGRADASTIGGTGDTVIRFAEEAWAANAVLRLYEAATRESGPDIATIYEIMEYGGVSWRWRQFYTSTPERARDWALVSAAGQTQERVTRYCHPALYRQPGHNHFREAPAFRNLLGALWLEMFWLLLSNDTRRCHNAECNRVVPFEPTPARDLFAENVRTTGYATRVDKRYCSKRCANRHYYKTTTKARRQASRPG
jgi:hypothetical protein